jgi:hypothetical protein
MTMKKAKYFVLFLTGITMCTYATYFTTVHTILYLIPLSILGGYLTGTYFYKFITYK